MINGGDSETVSGSESGGGNVAIWVEGEMK